VAPVLIRQLVQERGSCGTFFPFLRASDRPMAIACLRLVTFFPLRPLLSLPEFRLCIARFTSLEALREYLLAIDNLLAMIAALCRKSAFALST